MANAASYAQGPTVDPSFLSPVLYQPATVRQAFQQADGKRVLLGNMTRVGGTATGGLVRLLAGSALPDAAFQANVSGLSGDCAFVSPLLNNQLLLVGSGTLTLGAVTRPRLLRLNADGTADAGFDAGSGVGVANINAAVVQPDGKVLVAGDFLQVNGQAAGRLVRLNADGSLDAAFQTALGTGLSGPAAALALQPDGKVLVAGSFGSVNGVPRQALVRLLPSGAVDAGFVPAVPSPVLLNGVAVQPDGRVLVSGTTTPTWQTLMRLDATGALDAGFQNGTGFSSRLGSSPYFPAVVVQPDGKILVVNFATSFNGTAIGRLVRLLPGGGLDPAFANATAVPGPEVSTVQVLATGQLLVASAGPNHYAPVGSAATSLAVLNADGSRDPAFAPRLQVRGTVRAVVRQADGQYIIGGQFTEINGVAAGYLARLHADGTPDAAFTTAAAASDEVQALALQPDGAVLVGGLFERLAGGSRVALGRLLPTGALDAGFAPAFVPAPFGQATVRLIAVQNDGRVLVEGQLTEATAPLTIGSNLLCLNGTTGLRDPSFPAVYSAEDLLVQPDGNLVVAGSRLISGVTYPIYRLLPSGALDPAFVLTAPTGGSGATALRLTRDATGRLYAAGSFVGFGGLAPTNLVRLLANGTPDPTFAVPLANLYSVLSLAVQPNGRVLVGGQMDFAGTAGSLRVLATGAPDASYAGTSGPAASVYRLLVQADGAIMAAGDFARVGGQASSGLVRLLDANVLSVSNQQLAARTQVWPVPAHGQLHLALDAASGPRRVEVLDVLGRVVLVAVPQQPALTLDVTPVPMGTYAVRVHYAQGVVTRRVVVE